MKKMKVKANAHGNGTFTGLPPAPVDPNAEPTNAQKFWSSIKDREVNMFGMASRLADVATFVDIDPEKCYLLVKTGAVVPALEEVLGRGYSFNWEEKYLLVSKDKITSAPSAGSAFVVKA